MMNKNNRKGFTTVELVIVIAVVAVLAAALIFTVVKMNNQVKMFTDYQEETNQQIADLTEQLEQGNYLTAEQIQTKFAEELAKLNASGTTTLTQDQINSIVNAVVDEVPAALTEAQVKSIVKEALKGYGGLSDAEIEALIKKELNK